MEEWSANNDLEFCEWMAQEVGVAVVPESSFFKNEVNNLIMLHFAKKKETLEEALNCLEKLREKASKRF